MTIRYLSFAFDGCLLNTRYLERVSKQGIGKAVQSANKMLLKQLKKEGKAFTQTNVFIGSTRRDFNPSHCPAALAISKALGARPDPLLMDDILKERQPGESFHRTIKSLIDNTFSIPQPAEGKAGHSIIPLLFAQLYKAAQDNPDEAIVFEVWTGRREDIDQIEQVFGDYRNFIPSGIQLHIRLYDGEMYELDIALDSNDSITALPGYLRLAAIMDMNLERLALFSNGLPDFVQSVSSAIYPQVKTLSPPTHADDDDTVETISSCLFFSHKPSKHRDIDTTTLSAPGPK
ncbi:hypothetical protein DIZ81_10970 [Legionella taurinensis]|uniref:NYN domain-containing protein n=1 Tax=Legionella taurinensis TaxID=70611 RepID=A0AB38N3M2_9GAMM|nr:hypothetical protein [Legionella taurinensis]MDX1838371.1 hypothetical protein [Legionella taurinensis]PUT39132.1 hypothetical protein DB744_10980 [Legionella taurinensis]PUT39757.1 hypothetical protein DB746_13155 [Legionella taurinensis]PUT43588.1 hypothetical protein DB743_10370 [Legionella taurinensis]PUT45244.1 hypothetical protein DB745_13095 [Legionella taurinensis]